jgi:predicted nucleic acid-binding Zn ribbon protein
MTQKSKQGFTKISKILPEKLKTYNLQSAIDKARVVKVWHQASTRFLEDAVELTKAIDYKAGVLFVACLSQELAYQIKLMASRIILAINELLGKNLVWSIKLEV